MVITDEVENAAGDSGEIEKATTVTIATIAENLPQLDSEVEQMLKNASLTSDNLKEEVEYLIDDMLVKNSITMLFSKAGQGKSYFVLCICLMLLDEKKIRRVIYLDFDNPTVTLKNRKLDEIIDNYGEQILYVHSSKACRPSDFLETLSSVEAKDSLKDSLVVIDSIRDFTSGKDINTDKDIIPLMSKLKALRDMGSTVIFLHHSKKSSEFNEYKGSSSFIDSIDCAYGLAKKKGAEATKVTIILTVEKDRLPISNVSFELDTGTKQLVRLDYELSSMSESETEFVGKIKNVLAQHPDSISQNALLEKAGYRKDDKTGRKLLDKFEDKFWLVEQSGQNKLYKPLLTVVEK
jgi:AAA domain